MRRLLLLLLLPPLCSTYTIHTQPDHRSVAISIVGVVVAMAGGLYMANEGRKSFAECCASALAIIVGTGAILASEDIVKSYDDTHRPGLRFSFNL